MAKRTAEKFSRKMIAQIATQYANTPHEYSSDYFCREYSIKKHTFYAILEKAVIINAVPSDIVELMAIKARVNSEIKAGEPGGIRSEKHYKYLTLKGKQYMLAEDEIIVFTTSYANSKLPKIDFCSTNCITTNLLDRTIYKAIVENIVSDDVVTKLKEKSLQKDSSEYVIKFWEKIENSRNENKNNQV